MQRDVRLVVGQATGLAALTAVLVSGCGMTDGVVSTMSMHTSETVPAVPEIPASQGIAGLPGALSGGVAGPLRVTPHQRGYLDALAGVGVQPSSELFALTIGSYVCQGRAANQSDQTVWDFVLPMVRGEVRDAETGGQTLPVGRVNSVTADYIRIATERLC